MINVYFTSLPPGSGVSSQVQLVRVCTHSLFLCARKPDFTWRACDVHASSLSGRRETKYKLSVNRLEYKVTK